MDGIADGSSDANDGQLDALDGAAASSDADVRDARCASHDQCPPTHPYCNPTGGNCLAIANILISPNPQLVPTGATYNVESTVVFSDGSTSSHESVSWGIINGTGTANAWSAGSGSGNVKGRSLGDITITATFLGVAGRR